jgi:hypothetical protein
VQGGSSSSGSDPNNPGNAAGLVQRTNGRAAAINVQLSVDETYADIVPVRQPDALTAFVSIMRGCNNSEPRLAALGFVAVSLGRSAGQ